MKVEREQVKKHSTSCNFCDKGKLSLDRIGVDYPYEEVITFIRDTGNGLKASICEDCLEKLYKKANIK